MRKRGGRGRGAGRRRRGYEKDRGAGEGGGRAICCNMLSTLSGVSCSISCI